MRDTPETDHLEKKLGNAARHSSAHLWLHARRMERQRDQAREQIKYNLETTLIIERMIYEEREKSNELRAEIASLRAEIKEALG